MHSALPSELILYADRTDYGVARVELVRDRHYTSFPWSHALGRWDRRRFRIARHRVLAVLPASTDPAPIAAKLNVFANQRAAERVSAQFRFLRQVESLAGELRAVPEDA